jgi:hypothetical protein
MTPSLSWVDILFFGIFLVPNLVLQLAIKELLILCFLAIPYGIIAPTNSLLTVK